MPHVLTPYIYSITSTICFVIMQVFFKMLIQVIPQSTVLSTQAFFLLCLNSYILFSQEKYKATYEKYAVSYRESKLQQESLTQLQSDHRYEINILDSYLFRLLLQRLAINCLGVCVMSLALKYLPLSIVNSLLNISPIMIFFIQAYFYKVFLKLDPQKPLSKVHLVLTFISFIGVLIVVNPFQALKQQKQKELWSFLLPIISAVLASFGFIFLHELKGRINQFIMLEYTYIAQVLLFHLLTNFEVNQFPLLQSSPHSQGYFSPSYFDPYCMGAFIVSILLAYIANYCRIKSLFMLPPSKVVPLSYVGIVLSLLIDVIVFKHETNYTEILGIMLTSAGLLSHLVLEMIQDNQKGSKKVQIQ